MNTLDNQDIIFWHFFTQLNYFRVARPTICPVSIKFNFIFQVGGRRKSTSESLEVKDTRKSLIVSKDASFYIITIVTHINTLVL